MRARADSYVFHTLPICLLTRFSLSPLARAAVAFDVYELAFGRGRGAYALRVFALILAILLFTALFVPTFVYFVARAGGLFDGRGWRALARHHWGSGGRAGEGVGILRRLGPEFRAYFGASFHPWDFGDAGLLRALQPPGRAGGKAGKGE